MDCYGITRPERSGDIVDLVQFQIWWVANGDIEPNGSHDPVELDEPVERLDSGVPFSVLDRH